MSRNKVARVALGVVLVLIALLAEAGFWYLAFANLDKPQISAALVGAASGLIVAVVGIVSSLVVTHRSLENSLRLFSEQQNSNRQVRFIQEKRVACVRLLVAATGYADAKKKEEALKVEKEASNLNDAERLQVAAAHNDAAANLEQLLDVLIEAKWTLRLIGPNLGTPLDELYEVLDEGSDEERKEAIMRFRDHAQSALNA